MTTTTTTTTSSFSSATPLEINNNNEDDGTDNDNVNDSILVNTNLPELNSRTIVYGRSKMGKTTLLIKMIIEHFSHMVDSFVIMSATYPFDEKWKAVKHRCPQPRYAYTDFNYENISTIYEYLQSEARQHRNTLFVIDDMTRGIRTGSRDEYLLDRIIANSRWINTTIVHSAQKIVHICPELRQNFESLICFSPETPEEFKSIYENCGRLNKDRFESLIQYCTRKPYEFFYIKRIASLTYFFHCFSPLEIIYRGQTIH